MIHTINHVVTFFTHMMAVITAFNSIKIPKRGCGQSPVDS